MTVKKRRKKRQMNFFTSSVCDLLIWIAEHSLAGTSHAGNYQPDVRALKQQLHDSFQTEYHRVLCD